MRERFWSMLRGRTNGAGQLLAGSVQREPELVALRIVTSAETFTLWVPAPNVRVTDWLNSTELI